MELKKPVFVLILYLISNWPTEETNTNPGSNDSLRFPVDFVCFLMQYFPMLQWGAAYRVSGHDNEKLVLSV